ncbi:MAG: RidA family protein [Alphaproteobacteria bacterium]|nr:RidA family protein [Alphaproteobacteria bacterium]TAD89733.1 MAG: RidA family protein [Alphaproteobacteria bacterium]
MSIEDRLAAAGIVLPPVGPPMGSYVHAVRSGALLTLAGKGPQTPEGQHLVGLVGAEIDTETAKTHARATGLMLLAVAQQELGSLDRVTRVVKVLGLVRATPEFGDHPAVINGCSELFLEVFGERGRHARSAVGMGGLPIGITVEIEAIFEVAP